MERRGDREKCPSSSMPLPRLTSFLLPVLSAQSFITFHCPSSSSSPTPFLPPECPICLPREFFHPLSTFRRANCPNCLSPMSHHTCLFTYFLFTGRWGITFRLSHALQEMSHLLPLPFPGHSSLPVCSQWKLENTRDIQWGVRHALNMTAQRESTSQSRHRRRPIIIYRRQRKARHKATKQSMHKEHSTMQQIKKAKRMKNNEFSSSLHSFLPVLLNCLPNQPAPSCLHCPCPPVLLVHHLSSQRRKKLPVEENA